MLEKETATLFPYAVEFQEVIRPLPRGILSPFERVHRIEPTDGTIPERLSASRIQDYFLSRTRTTEAPTLFLLLNDCEMAVIAAEPVRSRTYSRTLKLGADLTVERTISGWPVAISSSGRIMLYASEDPVQQATFKKRVIGGNPFMCPVTGALGIFDYSSGQIHVWRYGRRQ